MSNYCVKCGSDSAITESDYYDGKSPRETLDECLGYLAEDVVRARAGETTPYQEHLRQKASAQQEGDRQLDGLNGDYYTLEITNPKSLGGPYLIELVDIIEAMEMTYNEGNAFKAIWRRNMARRGMGKKGNTALYESEKASYFSERMRMQDGQEV